MSDLRERDPAIFDAIAGERRRQTETLYAISSTLTSTLDLTLK